MHDATSLARPSVSPVFVVGTGRCGSTLLSNIIRDHPALLSLSEFFTFVTDLGSRIPQAFPAGLVEASAFWSIVSTAYPQQNLMLRSGVVMDEVLYPFTSSTARFHAGTGVPAVLQTTLPHLTNDPDALFDEMEAFVRALPPAPVAEQYRRLFTWLMQCFGKQTWVERTGSSLRIVARLVEQFPEARFVHLVRDGRDCALSMSRHYGFRMMVIAFSLLELLGHDPFEDADRSTAEELPDDLYAFLPEHFDAEAFRHYQIAPSLYGHYWSGELIQGLATLAQLPPERVLTLQYEEILADPEQAIRTLLSFVHPSYVHEAWIGRAASVIHAPRSSWKTLSADEQRWLEAACQPGFRALQEPERRS
jgi:hypothetical protein